MIPRTPSWLRFAAILFALTSVSLAQSTWIVDFLQRPGFHFQDLPPAVSAASPGDHIFVRAVSSDLLNPYTAPVIQGKGLIIQGELDPGLPPVYVVGPWLVSGVPAGQNLLIRGLTLRGYPVGSSRYFRWTATSCAGPLVFERVVFQPENQHALTSSGWVENAWTDCALVSFVGCTIDRGDQKWNLLRTAMTMTGCTMYQTPIARMGLGTGLVETMILDASQLTLASSTIRGGNSYSTGPFGQVIGGSEAIHLRNSSTIVMGASSVLMGGTDTIGGRNRWTYDETLTTSPSTLWRDASCQLIGRALVQCCPLEYVQPQTGIVPTESPGQIQIEQTTEPSAPTILLLAPLQTTPWSFVIGPVYLDPTNLWSDLSIAPASGVLTRTLTIPPSIPIGQWVGAQAFSLDSTGRIMASNVTTVGVW